MATETVNEIKAKEGEVRIPNRKNLSLCERNAIAAMVMAGFVRFKLQSLGYNGKDLQERVIVHAVLYLTEKFRFPAITDESGNNLETAFDFFLYPVGVRSTRYTDAVKHLLRMQRHGGEVYDAYKAIASRFQPSDDAVYIAEGIIAFSPEEIAVLLLRISTNDWVSTRNPDEFAEVAVRSFKLTEDYGLAKRMWEIGGELFSELKSRAKSILQES